jgi:hypothetical protein
MAKDGADVRRGHAFQICTRDVAMKGETRMTAVMRHALVILHALEEADVQLVGKAVVLTDGTVGTVEAIWLDDLHGLRISINGHPGKRPVSAVKFAQG